MFIRLNAAAFIKIFVIQVRCLFEGGVYLKFNLLFANNSMVTDHFNCKKQKHVLVLVLNFTICVLILLQYLMWNKVNIVHPISMSLSSSWSESKRYNDGCALSKSEPVHSKGFVPCLLRTCNCDRSNNRALPQGCRSLGQWIMSSTGRFNMQLERVFLLPLWVALLKNQEFTPKWYFSGIISNFSSCFFVNSHGTQPIIPFKCKWPWTACSKKRPVPGYTWWTLLALLLDRFFFPTAIRKQYYLQFCSRRSSRLIVINHQPVFHCPRACLHECGGPQVGEVTRLTVG